MSQHKSIDGLKKKSKCEKTKHQDNFFKTIILIIAIILVLLEILYLLPAMRAKISLLRMMWSGKYLVLFQNNSELRATGGFIGSFAVVDTKYDRVSNIYFDSNIYKRDNAFMQKIQGTPEEEKLRKVIPYGNPVMRDANWALDYSEAAQQIAWFYKNEGGTDVDGVIALDMEFFKNLLEIIGPVNLPKYQLEINKDNFQYVVQTEIEQNYFQDQENVLINEPKSILEELMPIVLARIKNAKNWLKLYSLIFQELQQKHLLLFSFNPSIESTIVKENWGGTIQKCQMSNVKCQNFDYLYLNNSNLGVNKSSILVKENITLDIQVTNDKIIHNLTFERNYPNIDLSNLKYFAADNVNNKNYTRLLVPAKANLISALFNDEDKSQDIISQEFYGKTQFDFWSDVAHGQETIIKINYETPAFQMNKKYSLYVQKQPGAVNQNLKIAIDGQVKYEGIFDRDLEIK